MSADKETSEPEAGDGEDKQTTKNPENLGKGFVEVSSWVNLKFVFIVNVNNVRQWGVKGLSFKLEMGSDGMGLMNQAQKRTLLISGVNYYTSFSAFGWFSVGIVVTWWLLSHGILETLVQKSR